MPTQKDLKATRKLKRKQTKVNNRRRNIGRKPLSFKHFYKTSHKRNRNDFESKHKNDDNQIPPHKKRKFDRNKPFQRRNPAFGFGKNMNEEDPDYKRFLADVNQSDSDDLSDVQDIDPIETALEQRSETQLMEENEQLMEEIKQHQTALESLKSADPEFYQHLQETDGNLLSFGDNNEFNLGDLGDIDDVVNSIQRKEIKQSMNEIESDDTANKQDVDAFMDDDDDAEDEEEDDDDVDKEDMKDIDDNDTEDDEDDEDAEDMKDIEDIDDDDIEDDDGVMFEFDVEELKDIIKDLEENRSIEALKRILSGFCSFVELTVDNDDQNKKKKKRVSKQSIIVANNPAFQHLLHYVLTKLSVNIVNVLDISSKEQLQISRLKDNRRYNRCKSILNRYLKYLYVFFKNVDDSAMQRLYLIHCKEIVFIILRSKESIKRLYLKHITLLWASTSASVRIDAFILLFEAAKRMNNSDNDLLNLLKYMYSAFVRICKRVSYTTFPGIHFMINCMKEMYALNPVVSYRDAFKRLRCIAFHVKQSIEIMAKHQSANKSTKELRANKLKQRKEETVQSIFNWRFINIIAFWSKILAHHSNIKNSDLHLLYYPFIQICCSVLTLSRSASYDPGKLKVIESLLDLIKETQQSQIMDRRIYVPLAPYLISIINNPAFTKKTKVNDDNNDVFDIKYKIKIGSAHFNTLYLNNSLLLSAIKCLSLYFCYYSYCISFPEIVFPTQIFLNEFISNPKISSEMKSIVKLLSIKLKENINWIKNKRKNVKFSPKDFQQINAFLAKERLNGFSPITKWIKSKQFENAINIKIKTIKTKTNDDNDNKNKIKQEKIDKKQRKKRNKMQNKLKYDQQIKDKKVRNKLKTNYKIDAKSKDAQVDALGDIVTDFKLSDDDDH